ncbi:MAG: hypothetical protein QXS54_03540 [Candidatus Methanomethylicaceae archaeon]
MTKRRIFAILKLSKTPTRQRVARYRLFDRYLFPLQGGMRPSLWVARADSIRVGTLGVTPSAVATLRITYTAMTACLLALEQSSYSIRR